MFYKQTIAQKLHPPACHSATIEELADGALLAVWYTGSYEGAEDTVLMSSRRVADGTWQSPRVMLDLPGLPVGNPVLDCGSHGLTLYFVILYGTWWTEAKLASMHSIDNGMTWTSPQLLRDERGLMLRTKPLWLKTGTCLLPIYSEIDWSPLILRSTDQGNSWTKYGDTTARGKSIQPTLVELPDGVVLMYTRTNQGWIFESRSYNDGQSWTASQPLSIPNPNSGIDMVRLQSGEMVLAYNSSAEGRNNLSIAMSENLGKDWIAPWTVTEGVGEFSYPTVMEDSTGLLHLVYTEHRTKIMHCEFNPKVLLLDRKMEKEN